MNNLGMWDKTRLLLAHSVTYIFLHCMYSIADNYKTWRETAEGSPLYVFAFSGPIFLAVDTFLLLGWDRNTMKVCV